MTMYPDDESLLSAYLDDELDEPQRLAVQAALKTNPALADELRELMRVRALIAALERPPTSYDLAGPVIARLGAKGVSRLARLGAFPSVLPRRQLLILATGLSTAAALLISVTFWVNSRFARPAQQIASPTIGSPALNQPFPAHSTTRGDSHAPVAVATTEPRTTREETDHTSPSRAADRAKDSGSAAPLHAFVGPDEEERKSDRDRQQILRYLDDPSVRRIFVTADEVDAAASQIDLLLRHTARSKPSYGKLTVNQGIVIDPHEPNRAVVFILRLDDKELKYLRSKLAKEPHLAVRDDDTLTPAIATLLADMGQVDLLAGTLAATLTHPPSDAASRQALRASATQQTILAGPEGGVKVVDFAASPASAEDASRNQANPTDPAEGAATVLVWVTSPAPAAP
jgi:anti-sigma factor RsiW